MKQNNSLTTQPINSALLIKRALIGGGIALLVISFFVFGVDKAPLEWGKFWMIRPLIITPLAGAAGGACTYLVDYFIGNQGGWKKVLAATMNVIGYTISLWLGTVLGLAGTMWH